MSSNNKNSDNRVGDGSFLYDIDGNKLGNGDVNLTIFKGINSGSAGLRTYKTSWEPEVGRSKTDLPLVTGIRGSGWVGTPKAGKSEQIRRMLENARKKLGLRGIVFNNEDLKEMYDKGDFTERGMFNLGCLLHVIQAAVFKTLDYKEFGMGKAPIFAVERNAFDHEVHTRTLAKLGYIDEKEILNYTGIERLARDIMSPEDQHKYSALLAPGLLEGLSQVEDFVVIMKVRPETAMRREAKDRDHPRESRTMQIPYLIEYNRQLDLLLPSLKERIPVLEIDGEDDIKRNERIVFDKFYEHMIAAKSSGKRYTQLRKLTDYLKKAKQVQAH